MINSEQSSNNALKELKEYSDKLKSDKLAGSIYLTRTSYNKCSGNDKYLFGNKLLVVVESDEEKKV